MQPIPTPLHVRLQRARAPFAVALALALAACAAPAIDDARPAAPVAAPASSVPTAPADATVPAPGTPASPVPSPTPETFAAPRTVAIVVPLTGRMAAAGTALRDGFMTAWSRSDAATRPEIRVYDAGIGATEAYRLALADGAGFVVGPLAREDVQAVAALADGTVPTLALNFLPDGVPPPPRFHQFALSPEDEARQVAERLLAEGRRSGVVLVPGGEWGSRVLAAFESTLQAGGGVVVARALYGAQTMDFSPEIVALLGLEESRQRHRRLVSTLGTPLEFQPRRREDAQFVFVAGQPVQGRLIRPQLKFHFAGDLPVYATSDVYDPNPTANVDLEGVTFPDGPWMLSSDPAVAAVRAEMQAFGAQNVRRWGRLYAMGFDAYRLVGALRDPAAVAATPVAGLTGRLTLDADGRIRRTLDWAVIGPDGQPRPLPPTAALPGAPAP